jgi:hypothetical protein
MDEGNEIQLHISYGSRPFLLQATNSSKHGNAWEQHSEARRPFWDVAPARDRYVSVVSLQNSERPKDRKAGKRGRRRLCFIK